MTTYESNVYKFICDHMPKNLSYIYRFISDSDFKEEDHPRANNGQFGSGGGNEEKKEPNNENSNKEYDDVVSKYKGTDKWLRAPNGEPTKLNEKQWVQAQTPSFKSWFGDFETDPENASKIVDENGDPLVVYHGSNKDFD
jgi:hypothetical protein